MPASASASSSASSLTRCCADERTSIGNTTPGEPASCITICVDAHGCVSVGAGSFSDMQVSREAIARLPSRHHTGRCCCPSTVHGPHGPVTQFAPTGLFPGSSAPEESKSTDHHILLALTELIYVIGNYRSVSTTNADLE